MRRRIYAAVAASVFFGFLMLAGQTSAANRWNLDAGTLAKFEAGQITTMQRLLRRLGYLSDNDMTRRPDSRTLSALVTHMRDVGFDRPLTGEEVLRSLFRTAWAKEGWGAGKVKGQDVVVDPAEVRAAQQALLKIGIDPGPVDGVFGPATFSAVEIFQEDNGMNTTGLLTRNTEQSILRRAAMRNASPSGVVRVLNWPDYMDPDVLVKFEKETGIKVVHEVFESSDETAALLMVGSSAYDVMVQSDSKMKQLVDDGQALAKLDHGKLSNAKHLDQLALTYTAVLDPDNKHSVPYMWGTIGIAVNETKLQQVGGGQLTFNSMDLFLDPAIAARVSKCGLAMVNEPADVVPLMIGHLGGDLLKITMADLKKVEQALSQVSQYIDVVSADRIITDMSKGRYCVAIGYSGDAFLARDTAAENGSGKISYHVPATGSVLWFDRFIIPKNARNVNAAYQFIDFLLKPKIAAANTNYLQYASPNLAATPYVEPDIKGNPGIYPPADVMKKLVVLAPLPSEISSEIGRIWSKLKTE